MWIIKFDRDNQQYFLVNSNSGKSVNVPKLTDLEIERKEYQRYFDKAYVMCNIYNGETVYLNRWVNGKRIIYRYTPKKAKE